MNKFLTVTITGTEAEKLASESDAIDTYAKLLGLYPTTDNAATDLAKVVGITEVVTQENDDATGTKTVTVTLTKGAVSKMVKVVISGYETTEKRTMKLEMKSYAEQFVTRSTNPSAQKTAVLPSEAAITTTTTLAELTKYFADLPATPAGVEVAISAVTNTDSAGTVALTLTFSKTGLTNIVKTITITGFLNTAQRQLNTILATLTTPVTTRKTELKVDKAVDFLFHAADVASGSIVHADGGTHTNPAGGDAGVLTRFKELLDATSDEKLIAPVTAVVFESIAEDLGAGTLTVEIKLGDGTNTSTESKTIVINGFTTTATADIITALNTEVKTLATTQNTR